MVSLDVPLPTIEELTVPELKITATPLLAAAMQLGKFCDDQCKEFMLCHYEMHDPRACIKEGKEVTACAQKFFRQIKKHCADEFKLYFECIHKYGGPAHNVTPCRSTQYIFDDCIKEKLGQDPPAPGYFNRVRLHPTRRPKLEYQLAPMPERLPDMPDFKDTDEPEYMRERRQINELFL